MKYKITRWQVITLSVAALVIAGFITSGWARNAVLPWLANKTAGQQVNDTFDSSFENLNGQLNRSGVHFKQEKAPPCYTVSYHYLRVSMLCIEARAINNGDNNIPIPATLVNDWPMILRGLAVGEQREAWRIDKRNTNVVDPVNLFKFTSTSRNMVGFMRNVNGVQCMLTITADPAQGIYRSDYLISEACRKDVKIFGGWDCTVDYCKP